MNTKSHESKNFIPQVKVCGLTHVAQALECAALGVSAIGCVFYPKSPRHLTEEKAKEICRALSYSVKTVGIFVNESFSTIMQKVERCGLSAVQLHGQESSDLVGLLRKENLPVIKALFAQSSPALTDASKYDASAFLVECGQGKLPGGNAMAWNWEAAAAMDKRRPFILAGGLTPENVSVAIAACRPDAVDVSSGVESGPGQKDLRKVASFLDAVTQSAGIICSGNKILRKIF